ncbi:MAG: hypothetical protein AB2777_22410, partial [Candidatus Thiodiazotropha endolucinida]
ERIFPTCQDSACGLDTRTEDCGEHWTSWHGVGGGHGNPCPSGCRRVGGSRGTSYRSVGFPPRPQEKNKYQCLRDVQFAKTCSHPNCGAPTVVVTGKVLEYQTCRHPGNGVSMALEEEVAKESNHTKSNLFTLTRALTGIYESGVADDNELNIASTFVSMFIDIADSNPQLYEKETLLLTALVKVVGNDITEKEVFEALGPDLEEEIRGRFKERSYVCK